MTLLVVSCAYHTRVPRIGIMSHERERATAILGVSSSLPKAKELVGEWLKQNLPTIDPSDLQWYEADGEEDGADKVSALFWCEDKNQRITIKVDPFTIDAPLSGIHIL